jgi:D-alanyl-D-alanine carboxypeptidase (penicillin-binding protein 5/6)
VLMDGLTGDVLLAHNPHLRIAPASFVKLLSLYVIFDALQHGKLRLEDEVYVSNKAWKTDGSKMFIEVNEKVSVEELLRALSWCPETMPRWRWRSICMVIPAPLCR